MDPFIGEIRMFAGNFPPVGWAFCDGLTVPVTQNEALFNLIGTTYGGDGENTFGLPNFCGRVPINQGTSTADNIAYVMGEAGGVETVILTTQQIPVHNHALVGSTDAATQSSPSGNITATAASIEYAIVDMPASAMNAQSLTPIGGNEAHSNMQPFLVLNFIISLFGIFPQP